jgi:hypothetical protein
MTRATFVRQPLGTVVSRYDRVARWYRFGEWTILLSRPVEKWATFAG